MGQPGGGGGGGGGVRWGGSLGAAWGEGHAWEGGTAWGDGQHAEVAYLCWLICTEKTSVIAHNLIRKSYNS